MNKQLWWFVDLVLIVALVAAADYMDKNASDILSGFMALKLAQIANKD